MRQDRFSNQQEVRAPSGMMVLLPLAVMLLLTLLVGLVSINISSRWQSLAGDVSVTSSQMVVLNNLYWNLREINLLQERGDEEAAHEQWEQTQAQVSGLVRSQGSGYMPLKLQKFFSEDENQAHIASILDQRSVFFIAPSKIRHQLQDLKNYSEAVTRYITLSYVVLGLTLMTFTAWDFWRLFRALVHSRDLQNMIQEDERYRIAQDLHDDVIQEMIGLKRDYSPEKLDSLIDHIRRICHNLKPQILDDVGLVGSLEFLANDLRQGGVESVRLSLDEESLDTLPKLYELPIFRIVQELFTNIKHHAEATQASLTVVYDPHESQHLRIYVKDNGKGLPDGMVGHGTIGLPGRLGLRGVEERARNLGGTLTVLSTPNDRGAWFQVMIPVVLEEHRRRWWKKLLSRAS